MILSSASSLQNRKSMVGFRNRTQLLRVRTLFGLLLLSLLLPISTQAQQSVVYGVFFLSPSCSNCSDVLTNHWPNIHDEFDDRLKILFIDVSTSDGSQIMNVAINTMHIQSNELPLLIIGSEVMIGSSDIITHAPSVIRAGLNSVGIGYPPIPNIDNLFQFVFSDGPPLTTEGGAHVLDSKPANLIALFVLLGLVASIGVMAVAGWQCFTRHNLQLITSINGFLGLRTTLAGVIIGVGFSGLLAISSITSPNALVISIMILIVFLILVFQLFRSSSLSHLTTRLIPLTIVIGVLVAGYLAYKEMSLIRATCGVMGDCNTVQYQYARTLGFSVPTIGIVGYLTIFTLWAVNQFRKQLQIDATIFFMAFLGVGFSIYLTLFETFVIGTNCVWCLTSAVVMGLLLWMTAPAGWNVVCSIQQIKEQ